MLRDVTEGLYDPKPPLHVALRGMILPNFVQVPLKLISLPPQTVVAVPALITTSGLIVRVTLELTAKQGPTPSGSEETAKKVNPPPAFSMLSGANCVDVKLGEIMPVFGPATVPLCHASGKAAVLSIEAFNVIVLFEQ